MRETTKIGMFTRNGLASAIALSAAALTSTAAAQDFVLEEVVVTAQKRAQSLQDVPISVAAVSGEQISNAGITGLEELSLYTPNVNINQGKASIPVWRLEEFRYGFHRLGMMADILGKSHVITGVGDGVAFNELLHARILSTPEAKLGLTPNVDTTYSSMFYDLQHGPLILSVPEIKVSSNCGCILVKCGVSWSASDRCSCR